MLIKVVYSLLSISVTLTMIIDAQSTETSTENAGKSSSVSNCLNETTDCDLSQSTNDLPSTTTPPKIITKDIRKIENKNSVVNVTQKKQKSIIDKTRSEDGICSCDLKISSCDINCCCDIDCRDYNTEELFSCKDQHPRIYDSRYCYDSNYIQQNSSRYLIEKLRDNLFCIVVDNLPPVYSVDYDPIISDRNILEEIIGNNRKSRFKWDQSTKNIEALFNSEEHYRYGDIIWKIENSYIKKLEIPQSGFTGICSFKKSVKYLEDWKDSCMQISLDNNNAQLFIKAFNNFSIIASPVLYNDSNFLSDNQNCPKTICVPVKSYYCLESWNSPCKNETTITGNCSNGTCEDIVKGIRFVITQNGLKGVNDIEVYLKLGNASKQFYQEYKIEYKWHKEDESEIIQLSGNPGYITGKPIIVGNLIKNKTNSGDFSYISVNREDYHLSLPVSKRDGKCSEDFRYDVNFGEDLKLSCKIDLKTLNFTINSCIDLQKQIIDAFLKKMLFNVTDIDEHSIHIAKLNSVIDNKIENNDWVKILFDRIPENIVTAQLIEDQIMCSGLVTSLRIDVIHRYLTTESKIIDNHKILAVSITFSQDEDIYWNKCNTVNCTDILSVDIISYVMFHDVTKPSKYFFVEGPNIDISLPNDFFYPFINSNSNIILKFQSHFIILCTCVFFTKIFCSRF